MAASEKNPTSPLRSGFDYQDTWALRICADWLSNPTQFQWMRLETTPDEVIGGVFCLDDIVLLRQNHKYHLYQIKHKQKREDYWTWEDLLSHQSGAGGRKKPSLLQRWFWSVTREDLNNKVEFAAFVTNGLPAEEIRQFMVNERIDFHKLKEGGGIYPTIKGEFPDELSLERFLSIFRFRVGQKDISDLEEEARAILCNGLKATERGVDGLLDQIRRECRKSITSKLTLEDLKKWCEFDEPRPLNESFDVPSDFQLFNTTRHQELLSDLLRKDGGIRVLCGKPGSGKSTYVSELCRVLKEKGVVCIRHHYFVSVDDTNPKERLRRPRVEEAIKAQFKEHSAELGNLANQNSAGVPLHEFINSLASHSYQQGKAFVLIVDGLDHVLRYSDDKEELRGLIGEVCSPQPGLWIVLGTQKVAKQYLPQVVFDRCPEQDWVEIEGLGKAAVCNIIERNLIGLSLPTLDEAKARLQEKITEITQGNPLHLRYTLGQLKNLLGDRVATESECANLLPYGDGISQYYDSLWRQLPEHGKTIALIISCAGFRFCEGQLFEMIPYTGTAPTQISAGYKAMCHLLHDTGRRISIYHSSFDAFVLEQPEFMQQRASIKAATKTWLENSDYEELKWSQLRRLAYDLGDAQPILEIGTDWVIDALCFPREKRDVVAQLELAAEVAFQANRFGKAFELASLKTYYLNATDYLEQPYEAIWRLAFQSGNRVLEDIDLASLSSRQLQIVAQTAHSKGYLRIVDESQSLLEDRHGGLRVPIKGEIAARMPELPRILLSIVVLNRSHEVQRVHKYIKQFAESGWSQDLFAEYARNLLDSGQLTKVEELLKSELTLDETRSILDQCARYDLEQGQKRFVPTIGGHDHRSLSPFCLLFLLLNEWEIDEVPPLPQYEDFPLKVPEYESGRRQERAKIFSDNFALGLVYGLAGKAAMVREWSYGIGEAWPLQMMSEVFKLALRTTEQLRGGPEISFKQLFEHVNHVAPLTWPEHRDLYELQRCLTISLSTILDILCLLKRKNQIKVDMGIEDVREIVSGRYYNREDLLKLLLEIDAPLLAPDAFVEFIGYEGERWKTNITSFEERAGHYADLAELASIHGDTGSRDALLRLAARNLVGYGYHKDMYLDGVLASIELCHKSGSDKIGKWIGRIAPIVENVTEYTDGDTTRYLPTQLADLLGTVNPGLLLRYYSQKASDEELYLAQDIFKRVLGTMDFAKDENVALAATALDRESLGELTLLAQTSDGAKRALRTIEEYFGHIVYPKEQTKTSSTYPPEAVPQYSTITPEKLDDHLRGFKSGWDKNRFLVSWAEYWLTKEGENRRAVYGVLVNIAEKDGLQNAEAELLDILCTLALELDSERAFDYLCWAQANDDGWQPYFGDKKRAQKRWALIAEHYILRNMEFFEKSIVRTGTRFGKGRKYYVPIPRGIEFLALFGKLQDMEEITEASIAFSEFLMADMRLPISEWLDSPNVDALGILLQRLTWPSPLVRERAATGLANLLRSAEHRELVLERLRVWVKSQQLESVMAMGLLPVLKAAEAVASATNLIDVESLANAMNTTSVVTDGLLERLATVLNESKPECAAAEKKANEIVPATYSISSFFKRNIKGFLPPAYTDWAEMIDRDTRGEFTLHWSYCSEQIMGAMGLTERQEVLHFMRDDHSAVMPGMSTMLSEVYRSAFLRVLRRFYDRNLIKRHVYLWRSFATLPVDLSFWKVNPNRAPAWWPKLKAGPEKNASSGLQAVCFERGVEEVLDSLGDSKILAMEGSVEPRGGWSDGTLNTAVTLVPFAYRLVGPRMPKAQAVADLLLYSPRIVVDPLAGNPFSFLEAASDHVTLSADTATLDDMLICPLVARVRCLVNPTWQWFRHFYVPFGVSHQLTGSPTIKIAGDSWKYVVDGRVLAIARDWLEGLRERHENGLEIPAGNYTEIDAAVLKSLLIGSGLRVGYVLKTTHKYRMYTYEEAKSVDQYALIRVSNIITP